MKKIFIILAILSLSATFLFAQSGWVDVGGSTEAATSSEVFREIKDIENDVHDDATSSKRVVVTSGSLNYIEDIVNVVASSDTTTHERLDSMYLLISTNGDSTLVRLDDQFVLISTNGDSTLLRLDNQFVLTSTNGDATLARLDNQFVLISTSGDTTISRLDSQLVFLSTNGDLTITRLDTVNDKLNETQVLIATGSDATLSRLDNQLVFISTNGDSVLLRFDSQFVLTSTNGDSTLTRLDDQFVLTSTATDGIRATLDAMYLLISTNTDATMDELGVVVSTNSIFTVITSSIESKVAAYLVNPPSDYPDATAQSSLSNIDTNTENTYHQMKSSVAVFYKVIDSTYVWRNFYANGSLTVNFNVKSIGVYSKGGDSTLTWDGGDIGTIWDGIPFLDAPIDETFNNPVVFTFTLTSPTTFSMYIRGKL